MRRALTAAVLGLTLSSLVAVAQVPPQRTVWDAVYSGEQARAGERLFVTNCAGCHKDDLSGGGDANGDAPALAGPDFMNDHEGATVDSLFAFMKANMPPDNPGGLQDEQYAAVIAYLLEANGFPAGEAPLPPTVAGMRLVRIEPQGGLTPPPNFALVQVVACLMSRDGQWFATRATAPVRARVPIDAANAPLGTGEFRLMDVGGTPTTGRKAAVTGILIRDAASDRVNVTALRVLDVTC